MRRWDADVVLSCVRVMCCGYPVARRHDRTRQTASLRSRPRLDNASIAERLEAFASLLDLAESDAFASRAYRRAAGTVRETPASVEELVRTGRVRELRGIGPGIARRLEELVETGRIAELDDLERELRPELIGLGRLIGLGPKR